MLSTIKYADREYGNSVHCSDSQIEVVRSSDRFNVRISFRVAAPGKRFNEEAKVYTTELELFPSEAEALRDALVRCFSIAEKAKEAGDSVAMVKVDLKDRRVESQFGQSMTFDAYMDYCYPTE